MHAKQSAIQSKRENGTVINFKCKYILHTYLEVAWCGWDFYSFLSELGQFGSENCPLDLTELQVQNKRGQKKCTGTEKWFYECGAISVYGPYDQVLFAGIDKPQKKMVR